MQFDIFTALAASCGMTVVLGGLLLLFWLRDRKTHWLLWWCVGFELIGLGMSVFMWLQVDSSALNSLLGSSSITCGLWAIWQGARAFEGRKLIVWPLLVAVSSQLLMLFPTLYELSQMRVALASLPKAMLAGATAYEFWRGRAEHLPSRMPIIVMLLFLTSFLTIRVPFAFLTIFPGGNVEPNHIWVGAVAGLIFLVGTALVMLFNAMTHERREVSHKFAAQSDPLTGLLNRRALTEAFGDGPLMGETSVIVFDLDCFKHVNDTHGHAVGDECLRVFTQICRKHIRQVDIAVRLGGEEFAVVLPDTSIAVALAIAERIRRVFAKTQIETGSGKISNTVSAGVHVSRQDELNLEQLLKRADAELYAAKRNGRNQVSYNTAKFAA